MGGSPVPVWSPERDISTVPAGTVRDSLPWTSIKWSLDIERRDFRV